jgi:hypothetical protein
MPSIAYRQWVTTRAAALDEIARAHIAVGGTRRGRRYATQQLNRLYAVLLASEFQGFCRDLHSECVDHLIRVIAPPSGLVRYLRDELTRGRQLDRGNAHPGSIGADFGRFDIKVWVEVAKIDPQNAGRRLSLEALNNWRNAVAHQDFTPSQLGGTTVLRLAQVRRWRASCRRLARALDEVMRLHLQTMTGTPPW